MTIAIDEVIAGVYAFGASPQTITKVGATSPTALTIQFYLTNGITTVVPSSVTYGSTPITISSFDLYPAALDRVCYYGSLINPPSGAQSLVINYSGSAGCQILATFWTGDVASVSWTTRALATVTPVVSIARAATSAIATFAQTTFTPQSLVQFLGDGTEREIYPYAADTGIFTATQEPAQGSGSIDWQYNELGDLFAIETAHVSAEIVATTVIPVGNPLTTIRARVRRFLTSARERQFSARPRTR